MKPSIQLRLSQQLTMTPQLQQAIKLLQLSALDLQMEVQEALETNPMLELAEDEVEAPGEAEASATSGSEAEDRDLDLERNDADIPADLPVDSAWDDIYDVPSSYSGPDEGDEQEFANVSQGGESLQEHLLWQASLAHFNDRDMELARLLIDGIDERGYLGATLEELLASLDPEFEVELDELEAVLHRIQTFDPVGVGARNLGECLSLQLRQLPAATPWRNEALNLVENHLELLGSRDYAQVQRRMKISEDELREVIQLIQTLNPRPGNEVGGEEPQYVVPDVTVRKHRGSWLVELNPEASPRLRVNPGYAALVRRADNSQDNNFLRTQLQEARWFLKSIQSRNETLLKVATCIVEHQRGFLEHGEEAMKPLVLHDIAEAVEMHESTISRVTTQKYMLTPRGIFELKYFFSSHVSTASGGEASSTAIRALIKKLIAAEHPSKPLSDSKIAKILSEQGVNVARRTIAKYREVMAIPPSNERKRLL